MEDSNKDQLKLYSGKMGMIVNTNFTPLMYRSVSLAIVLFPCTAIIIALGWSSAEIVDSIANIIRAKMGH